MTVHIVFFIILSVVSAITVYAAGMPVKRDSSMDNRALNRAHDKDVKHTL